MELLHVCPSVRPPARTNNSAPTGRIFVKFNIWVFRKSVEKIQVSLQSDKNNGHFTWRRFNICQYPSEFFLEWKIFRTNVAEKIKTHILCLATFSENSAVYEILGKNIVRPEGATNDNTIRCVRIKCWINKTTRTHAHAQADAPLHTRMHVPTLAHAHTGMCNTYCLFFFAATMVSQTRLNVTLHIPCLSCFILRQNYFYVGSSVRQLSLLVRCPGPARQSRSQYPIFVVLDVCPLFY